MNSPLLCGCLIVSTIVIILTAYTNSFIDDMYTVTPIFIASNREIKEKAQTKSNDAAERSPFFKSLKTRYNQVFPHSAS
jgi:hypothetical protein